jgi:endonuclease-3
VVPEEFRMNAHHWLILHGRYTCVALKPKCAECVVYEQCGWKEKKKFAAAATGASAKPARRSVLPKQT